ncbi:MAG: DNA sulfur modification protein DndD [Candidatus Nanoarchaeia archaeon]|nr:DNA sulfur modification protein DndD [Candidatus Nanoarchaeia archaeon]
MIIKKMILENYGLYYGRQEFDLNPSGKKNIILIGGKNGNGKTTFFEAIQLGLYGARIFDKKSQKKYQDFLLNRIHFNPFLKEQPNHASIQIEFEYSSLGELYNYKVKRYWEKQGNDIIEKIGILKNDKPLNDLESEQWQDFINDLIPYALLKLFFFDGEKIQNLAEEINNNNEELAKSFKALLGLDLIEKLKNDLSVYSIKQLKNIGKEELQKNILETKQKINDTDIIIDDFNTEKAQIQAKMDNILSNLEKQEELVSREGGVFATKRDSLKTEISVFDTRINILDEKMRELCSDIFPFVLSPNLNQQLKNAIIQEEIIKNQEITAITVKEKLNLLKQKIKNNSFWNDTTINSKNAASIAHKIISEVGNSFIMPENSDLLIHNVSSQNRAFLVHSIDKSSIDSKSKFFELVKEKEELLEKMGSQTKQLNYAPSESIINPYIKKIGELNLELGSLTQKMNTIVDELRKIMFLQDNNKRKLNKVLEEMKKENDLDFRMSLINKLDIVLNDYNNELKNKKIEEFSSLFLDTYNQLAEKKNVFKKIFVDPENFSVTFYKGEKVDQKSDLSAGEKQIYAISVLWTLTKMSKKTLPFIIDTPLGRLDLNHRDNLINNFFPNASHQVIILSTDTEIGNDYLIRLNNKISKKYLLNFDNHCTTIKEGYFTGDKNGI